MIIARRVVCAGLAMALAVCAGTGCSKRARKERMLASANRDFQAGQYDKAEVEYRAVLQIPPLSSGAVRQLGFVYFEEGRLSQAFPYLNKAAQLEPKNADVQIKLAATYLGARKYKEAREAVNKVLEQRPGDELALQILADSAAMLRDGPKVRETIEKLRQNDQDRSGYHLGLAVLDLQRQNMSDSKKELQQALALNPNSGNAYFLLGGIYLQEHDLKEAQQAFQSAAQLSPLRSTARLRYAEFQWQTGATNQAQTNLEQLTAQAPDYISAWLILMRLTFAERRLDDCRSIIKTILVRDPANYEALMQSGILSMAQRDGTNAVATYLRMQELYKTTPQVPYQLAMAYLLTGDKVKAVASLNQSLFIDAQFAPAILALAELDIRANRPAAAIGLLQPLIKQQPRQAKAKLLLADAYLAAQTPSEALAVYRQLAETFPKDPTLQLNIGLVLEQQRDRAGARTAFLNALELSPGYPPALELLIDLDLADKRYSEAMERVDPQIDRNPKSSVFRLLKSKILVAQNNLPGAEAVLLKAIEVNPEDSAPFLYLAKVYIAAKKYQGALDDLAVLVKKTNNVSAWLQIAELHDQLKDYDAARDAYEKVLQLSPQATVAINNLAYLYDEHYRDLDKALVLAQKARELAPFSPNSADTLGSILLKKGEYPRALALLQEAAQGAPTDAEIQSHLGSAYYMMGEEAPARVALQRAVALAGESSAKEDAKRQLAWLSIDARTADAAAVEKLEKAAKDNSTDPVVLVRLAAIRERTGQVQEAASMYEKVLKSVPESFQATLKLAELYSGPLHQPEKALALAKIAHSLAPEDASASQFLGQLVFQSGDYGWSLNLLEEAARNNAGSPDLLYNLGLACYANGDVARAQASMQRAIQLNVPFAKLEDARRFLAMLDASKSAAQAQAVAVEASAILQTNANYVPALMVSALVQEQRGDLAHAQQLCKKALAIYPQFAPAVRLSGIIAYRRNDYAQSEQLLRRTAEKSGGDDEVNYYLGMDYFQLKRPSDSKEALQRVVASNPSGKFAAEAKLVLAKLK
jgi:tetratricopeptide (TPR) repeat protein